MFESITLSPGVELSKLFGVIQSFIVVSLRIGGFFAAAPFFGAQTVPKSILVLFTACVSIFLLNYVTFPDINSLYGPNALILVFSELFLGLVCGLFLSIIFAAVALAGEKIAASGGLSFAAQVDPSTGGQTPVVSSVLTLFSIVIFLSIDGHLKVLELLIGSYSVIPIGFSLNLEPIVKTGLTSSGLMFIWAAKIMLPAVMFLTFVNCIIGIVTRSAPQLNLFSFGFPITLMSLFFILYITVEINASVFESLINTSIEQLYIILGP